jgi:hypothetical protein
MKELQTSPDRPSEINTFTYMYVLVINLITIQILIE